MTEFLREVFDQVLNSGNDLLSTITDSLGDFIASSGIMAAFGLLLLEESGVPLPVPGDVMVLYVGHQVARGQIAWGAALAGFVLVVVCGASILYTIARVGGPTLLARFSTFLHLNERSLRRAEIFFQKRGALAIIFGRHVPGLRIPITLAAGVFKVPYPLFAASVAISTTIWAGLFLTLGALLGDRAMALLRPHRGVYLALGLGVGGMVIAMLLFRRRNRALPDRRQVRRAG
ncbi:MAG: DedA family protein [Candidatus Dormibacteria bacterium]